MNSGPSTPALKLSLASTSGGQSTSPDPNSNGKRILVVDDSVLILKTLSAKLRSQGYAVSTAVDGSAAVSTVRRERPDLILLDIFFPPDVAHGGGVAWDGFLIMSWLRRMDESLHTPVMIITGGDPAKIKDRCLAAGVAGFFQKPIQHEELLAAIKKILMPESEKAHAAGPGSARKRVLFVDDETDWRFMAGVYLQDEGYEVVAAGSGTEAVTKVRQAKPDLVLLDLNLAGESGLEVLKLLRVEAPDLRVVLYTGMDHDETAVVGMLALGAHQYLRKSTMGEMLQAVQNALAPAQAQNN